MGYISTEKLSKLAGIAFHNGLRLHFDAIRLFNEGSYPSALQLSILSQEEIGKAFFLEETVFRTWSREWPVDFQHEIIEEALTKHPFKQRWFNRFAYDFLDHHGRLFSSFTMEVVSGRLEARKQAATYAGLTKKKVGNKVKLDLLGRIVEPSKTKPNDAARQITRVNDLILVYTEGFIRSVYSTDIYEIALQMNDELARQLIKKWSSSSRSAQIVLKHLRTKPVVDDPLYEWTE